MAIATYDTTAAMVKERLPVDTTNIGSGTTPLSDEDIESYIEDGASQLTPILVNSGLSTTISDDDTKAQVQSAIIDFAVWKCLERLPGISDRRIQDAEDAWLEHLMRYSRRSEFLKSQASNETRSNVSTSSSKSDLQFGGLDYEF